MYISILKQNTYCKQIVGIRRESCIQTVDETATLEIRYLDVDLIKLECNNLL